MGDSPQTVYAQVFGRLEAFEPEGENITTYLERVELYFAANNIADDKQTSVLLTVIGTKNYGIIKSLVAPVQPKDKTYTELEAVLKAHFQPKPLLIAERFRFYQRNQAAGESVLDYVAELRRLAISCDFGEFLDQALRDRFVCGLRTESTQKRLLTERDLTLAKAVELASGMETAAADARELKRPGNNVTNNHVYHTPITKTYHTPVTKDCHTAAVTKNCHRCGRSDHDGSVCRFKQVKCHRCGKTGHIAPVCRSGSKGHPPFNKGFHKGSYNNKSSHKSKLTHHVDTSEPESKKEIELPIYTYTVNNLPTKPIRVDVKVAGKLLSMEVDTGAAVSILSESEFRKKFPRGKLKPSSMLLSTYTKEPMKVIGKFSAEVHYQKQGPFNLDLIIVSGDGPCLLGRSWLECISLDWSSIAAIIHNTSLQRVLEENRDVFAEELGTIRPFLAKLAVLKDARPKFHRARPIPFALKSRVEEALDRLEADDVLEKVSHSEWAAPIVAVPKRDGSIRVCGDYKVTVNPVLEVDQYPLPRPEDLFATLAGGKKFTTLDLSHAYNQLTLDPESQKYVVVNTHRGLYRYKRLPFGIASAPAQFQRVMDQILQGMNHVTCYLDDILITGSTIDEHLSNLTEVLRRLKEHGVRLKREKCQFLRDSVEYLGHLIDADGLHTTDSKLKAINEAPSPTNTQELRAFLGLLNYYGRFIPNRATLSQPLNTLLCKDHHWRWTERCERAFQQLKKTLVSSSFLTHYNPNLPLKLAGDASAYGVGAVISHTMDDGTEQPIAFGSRTLSKSEQNYSQIEKEALSLIYGVRKFHSYLLGRKFTLVTDHKPLTYILGPKRGIPPLAAARLQRWALILAAYNYNIEYRPTGAHANADSLSKLPLKSERSRVTLDEPAVFNVSQLESLPVTAKQLQAATRTDPTLSKVLRCMREGWPKQSSKELHPYWSRRLELTVEGGCILWGIRAIVPQKLRERLLKELHRDHPGISRMKMVARSYIWWPGLDQAIEDLVKSCVSCQSVKHAPSVAPLQPWIWPNQPWKRVHLDFAGPFQGAMFLLAVDAHSKWPEVHIMKDTTTTKTIDVLRNIFSSYGIPEQLVTDNGPQFISDDFAMFVRMNGIKHIRCAPYHPATNGLVERFVQSLKAALKASLNSGLPLHRRVLNFLFTYRSTPHTTTGVSPSSLFLHRRIRTRLDLLHPNSESQVLAKQAQQKSQHDRRAQHREFFVGQTVMARNLRPGPDWVPTVVVERLGPLTYLVETSNKLLWKRHLDLLRELSMRNSNTEPQEDTSPNDLEPEVCSTPTVAIQPGEPATQATTPGNEFATTEETPELPTVPSRMSQPIPVEAAGTATEATAPTEHRYPTRNRQPPDRLGW